MIVVDSNEPDSRRVLELVKTSRCSAYDCEFVATAEMLGTTSSLFHSPGCCQVS